MDFKDLKVYHLSFQLAMEIFEITKGFPKEEIYSLTDQIRRSSRSVPAQIAEAYRKRVYPKHFQSKLTDGDAENAETQVWLAFSFACKYISKEEFDHLIDISRQVGKLLGSMQKYPSKYGVGVKSS